MKKYLISLEIFESLKNFGGKFLWEGEDVKRNKFYILIDIVKNLIGSDSIFGWNKEKYQNFIKSGDYSYLINGYEGTKNKPQKLYYMLATKILIDGVYPVPNIVKSLWLRYKQAKDNRDYRFEMKYRITAFKKLASHLKNDSTYLESYLSEYYPLVSIIIDEFDMSFRTALGFLTYFHNMILNSIKFDEIMKSRKSLDDYFPNETDFAVNILMRKNNLDRLKYIIRGFKLEGFDVVSFFKKAKAKEETFQSIVASAKRFDKLGRSDSYLSLVLSELYLTFFRDL